MISNQNQLHNSENYNPFKARRRAASRKVKQMKQSSKDTDEMEDNEDLFADIGRYG